jgi:predicted Fe-Mo cluster-binding NifX family protein
MKIAVSSSGNNLDSQIDPRFGRCAYFVVADTENMNFEAFDNESIALGGGAGIQASQFVAAKGAKAILTGNVGPNAVKTLTAAGLEIFLGQSGTVREALDRYKSGDLKSTSTPNVADHHGMAGGSGGTAPGGESGVGDGGSAAGAVTPGRGMGGGGGRGMGGGGGRGMGGGCRRGMGGAPQGAVSQSAPLSREEELKRLKDQVNQLQEQIKALQ